MFESGRKKQWNSTVQSKSSFMSEHWKEFWVVTQERREVEVGTLLLGDDKNNVIVEKVLGYF